MRKVVWLAGVISVVGLAMTVGLAQERPAVPQSEQPRTGGLSFLTRPEGVREAAPAARPATRSLYREPEAANESVQRIQSSQQQPSQLQRYQRNSQSAAPPSQTGLKNYHQALFGAAPGQPAGSAAPQRRLSGVGAPPVGTATAPAELPVFRGGGIQQTGGSFDHPGSQSLMQAGFAEESGASGNIQQVSGTTGKAPLIPNLGLSPEANIEPGQSVEPLASTGGPLAPAGVIVARPEPQLADGIPTNFSTDSPEVSVRWSKNSDVNVGQPCDLTLTVRNGGRVAAHAVMIDAYFPATVRLIRTSPEPVSATNYVSWELPSLDAGEEREIGITLIPSRRGEIAVNANVRFTTAASVLFSVEEPMIAVAISGPEEVTVGEAAPQLVTVSNPGTGVAHNVIVEVVLPAGLEHPKGDRLKMDLGSLNPGEKRTVRLSLTAIGGGEQTVTVNAASGTELRETTVSKLNVLAPSLKLAVEGPSLRYVGRDARYTVHVTNDGKAATNNVRASYKVPSGFKFQSASNGGQLDAATGIVNWFIGSVGAKQTVELELRLKPIEPGDFEHVAKVTSELGGTADAATQTKIEGTASLVLEVVDLDDPVEIGRETAYEVRVSNEGSKEAQNVGLSVELPSHVELVNVKGPSQHIAESGLVVFRSLPALAPGKTAVFQIFIKGVDEGNQRVRARLTSDSIQEPLTVEELTRFYAD